MAETKTSRVTLSPEEKEARKRAKYKRDNERKKERGYPDQKKYRMTHPSQNYEPKIRIPLSKKADLQTLINLTGLTITQLFVGAVEEKYGVILHNDLDNDEIL